MSAFDQMSGPGLEAEAHLSVTLDRLERTLRHPRFGPPQSPVYFRDTHTNIVAADGTIMVNCRGPVQGFMWYVRSLLIGGTDPTVVTPGQADVFVTAARLPAGFVPSIQEWRDRATRLPLPAFYGRGEMELRHNEMLLIRFSGATSGQQVAVGLMAEVVQESAGRQEWGL